MLREVFRRKDEKDIPKDDSNCMNNEQICAIYERRLPQEQLKLALTHLNNCRYCRADLIFHYELMNLP